MKPEHAAFVREAAEVTSLLERLDDLIREYVAASPEREPALKAEIEEVKERVKRLVLCYQNWGVSRFRRGEPSR